MYFRDCIQFVSDIFFRKYENTRRNFIFRVYEWIRFSRNNVFDVRLIFAQNRFFVYDYLSERIYCISPYILPS